MVLLQYLISHSLYFMHADSQLAFCHIILFCKALAWRIGGAPSLQCWVGISLYGHHVRQNMNCYRKLAALSMPVHIEGLLPGYSHIFYLHIICIKIFTIRCVFRNFQTILFNEFLFCVQQSSQSFKEGGILEKEKWFVFIKYTNLNKEKKLGVEPS